MKPSALQSTEPRTTKRAGCCLGVAMFALMALMVVGIAGWVVVPSSSWIEEQLVLYAEQRGMSLTLGELDFSPWSRVIQLRQAHLTSRDSSIGFDVRVERIDIEIGLASLFSRELRINSVTLEKPVAVLRGLANADSRGRRTYQEVRVSALRIRDGQLSLGGTESSLSTRLEDVQYQANDVVVSSIPSFFSGANCTATIMTGGAPAPFALHAHDYPQTLTVTGLDLRALGDLSGMASGGLAIRGGSFDLRVRREAADLRSYSVQTVLRQLRVGTDPSAPALQRLLVAGLVQWVGDGNYDFSFSVPSDRIDQSTTLEQLVTVVLSSVVQELLSELSH